jgi:hypothetical protein
VKRTAFACIVAMAASTANAADREFKDVVRAVSEEFHTKPMHIPLMGLVNGFMKVAHPVGAKHVEIAIFQDIDYGEGSAQTAAASIRHAIGAWQPYVTTRNREGETVMIYMREAGKDADVLTVMAQRDQLVITEARVDPVKLSNFLSSPQVAAWKWSGTGHDDNNTDDDDPPARRHRVEK